MGSARNALVLLNKIIGLDDEDEMLDIIQSSSAEVQGFAIAKALFNYKTQWKEMAGLLKSAEKEEPETIRYIVLGYAKSVMLNGANKRAYMMLECFKDNFYDSKFAGLVHACWEVIQSK